MNVPLRTILISIGGLSLTHAGEVMPPMEMPPPSMPEPSGGGLLSDTGLSLAASVGYDSDYLWRGANYGDDLTWFDVSTGLSLNDMTSLSLGVWHGSWRGGNDELDVYAGLDVDLGAVTLSAGWTYFYFYDAGGDYHEFSLGASTSLGPVDLGLTYYIAPDNDVDYSYVEATAGTSYDISEYVSLDLGATLGYGDSEFNTFQGGTDSSGFTHLGVSVGLSMTLWENVTLSPYIAYNHPLDELEDAYDEDVYGGISLGIEF